MTQSIRKSDRTRRTILETARRLFGERGFDATTMRDVAAAAAVDPALIIRYFGSKDALFAKASLLELALPDLTRVARARIGQTLVRHFLTLWQGEGRGLATLLRSAASNDYAAEAMRTLFTKELVPALTPVCGSDAAKRAGLVGTQMLGLALCRFILRLPPIAAMSAEEVVAAVGPAIQRYIVGKL